MSVLRREDRSNASLLTSSMIPCRAVVGCGWFWLITLLRAADLEMLGVKAVVDGRIVQARTADRAADKLARCMIVLPSIFLVCLFGPLLLWISFCFDK